jgi:hypothetical protein
MSSCTTENSGCAIEVRCRKIAGESAKLAIPAGVEGAKKEDRKSEANASRSETHQV